MIKAEEVWKVYGPLEDAARKTLPGGLSDAALAHAALRGISLEIPEGELFVLIGLSGSGKSTFLRLLNGLISPTAGSVGVLGFELAGADRNTLRSVRSRVAMVFQEFALLPHRTLLDNVAFGLEVKGVGRREREHRALEVLELVNLRGRDRAYPNQLSGGQRQRVGLARALALDPDVLLMDEPFSALDALIRVELRLELLQLQRELHKTILYITHDVEDALRLGDRVGVLSEGRLLQLGRPEEILFHPADETVARFVEGINVFETLPTSAALDSTAAAAGTQERVSAKSPLAEAAHLIGANGAEAVTAVDDAGEPVGVVTAASVLAALAAAQDARARGAEAPA